MLRLAPDGDPTRPECLTAMNGLVPTTRTTYRSAYTANASSYPALADRCIGAYLATKSDGSDRLFAGTGARVYEATQAVSYSWTDVSSASYSNVSSNGWMFAQFGDTTIKVNKNVPSEASSSGAFSTTSFTTMPKAMIALTQSNALWAFNINDGTDKPDYFATSDQGVPGSWTIAAGSDAFQGALQDTPGPITAAITWQSGVLAFKRIGVYYLEYVGGTEKITARLLSAEHGCVGPRALCTAEGVVYFYSDRGIYKYDGSYPQLLSQEISSLAAGGGSFGFSTIGLTIAVHDEANSVVRFVRDFSGSIFATELTYNYKSGTWGYRNVDVNLQIIFQMTPAEAYDFPGIGTSGIGPAAPVAATNFTTHMGFNSSNVLVNYNNQTLAQSGASITGWFHGKQYDMTQVNRIYLGFYNPPVSTEVTGQIQSFAYPLSGSALLQKLFPSSMDSNDSISVTIQGRWLRPIIQVGASGGFFEIATMYFDPAPAGRSGGRS